MSTNNKMTESRQIDSCEVCGNNRLKPVLDLGKHPLCDDLVPIGESRTCKEYPIEILYCDRCATAHQRYQVPKQELFPQTYHYRSRFTADVLNGMSALVDACEKHIGTPLNGKTVLDVGCNDGSLLDFFSRKGAKTIGIEPTDAYLDGLGKGHDLLNGYFSPETARAIHAKHGSPDLITFTNVFAHIENLPELIESLKILISPTTMLVIENHYLGSVLDRSQFDTFYHEHPRTYSLTSFIHIAKSLGLKLSAVEFPSRYGGNIRVFLASAQRLICITRYLCARRIGQGGSLRGTLVPDAGEDRALENDDEDEDPESGFAARQDSRKGFSRTRSDPHQAAGHRCGFDIGGI